MVLEQDFSNIYSEYYDNILLYLSRLVGPDDAEDVAQDTFDKVSRNLDKFRQDSKLSTWIYRIATNTAIDRLRSTARKHTAKRKSLDDAIEIADQSDWLVSKSQASDQTLIRKEMSECVLEFIDNLAPDYKTVILLSDREGLTNKEIAEVLGISVDNVKVRLHRARAKLKTALNAGCDFYHNEQNTLACDRKQAEIWPKVPGKR